MTSQVFEVWENQRLSVSDSNYAPENRVSGDRPPWSSKDGKHAQHRDAFLLPDLSWQWDGTWFVADLDGNQLSDSNGGWLYAPSYLISTKRCSSEPNAFSLVRRRRWMRKAKKDPTLASMPHPCLVVHYGLSSAPEAVANCANSPMTNTVVGASPKTGVSAFAAMIKSPFQKLSNAFSSSSPSQKDKNESTPGSPLPPGSPAASPGSPASVSFSPLYGAEVALLLRHQATFDVMQTFMAELLAAATNPTLNPTIPPNIQQILRESGVPQLLRAPLWLGFSGALMLKMKNPGKYRRLLEKSSEKVADRSCPINLDVTRTYASHLFFAGGTGPGAKKLRNVLFAYQEQALQNLHETEQQKRKQLKEEDEKRRQLAADQSKATSDDVMDHLFAPAVPPTPVKKKSQEDNSNESSSGKQNAEQQHHHHHHDHGGDEEHPTVYHQPLSYIASVFILNCMDEEDAFWLLTVMAERCPLLEPTAEGGERMNEVVAKFQSDLVQRAPQQLQQILSQVDLSICAYGWFQALLCAHVSCPVASRLFDIFLIDVKNSMVFVDFAVALVLKCFLEEGALDRFVAVECGGGSLDTVSVSKFLNEQLRRVSCDIRL